MCEIRKNCLLFLLSVATVLCLCFPVFAAEKGIKFITEKAMEFTTENTTKQVVVELEAVAEEKEYFKPKEVAGYKLTIKNKLGPAWIRVKFDLTSKNVNQKFTDGNLNIQKGWVKRGEYFYYTEKTKAYTDYLVVDGVQIPDIEMMNKQDNEASVTICVYGEAIQYDSIIPDFSSETPWNGKKPEHSTHTSGSSHQKNSYIDLIHLYSSPQETGIVSTGHWKLIDKEKHIWKYLGRDGSYAKDGWIYVYNPYSQVSFR